LSAVLDSQHVRNVDQLIDTIKRNTGKYPKALVLSLEVRQALLKEAYSKSSVPLPKFGLLSYRTVKVLNREECVVL
jgi:hypothetical protein